LLYLTLIYNIMRGETTKEKILNVIKENPDGLTIQEIARKAKVSRITASIYVHELLGEGKVHQKKIGVYRIIFPKEKAIESVKEEELIERLKKKIS
ncbi:MAG: winged helix-turn-helix transcriptional regulator, partial [Candidatus Aenigmatarchaeota archaeon]